MGLEVGHGQRGEELVEEGRCPVNLRGERASALCIC